MDLNAIFHAHLTKSLGLSGVEASALLRRFCSGYWAECGFCNGYYGRNFGEPLCQTCHLHTLTPPSELVTWTKTTAASDKSDSDDSGNEDSGPDPNDSFPSSAPQVESGEDLVEEEAEERNGFSIPHDGLYFQVQSLSNFNQQEAKKLPSEWFETHIPPEVLTRIFFYLDDVSLWCSSQVSQRWSELVRNATTGPMWKRNVEVRFPFFQPLTSPVCWFQTYGRLVKATPCIKCLQAFIEPHNVVGDPFNGQYCCRRLASELRMIQQDAPEGIEARPINKQGSRWIASITGPAGSPYEGGKFLISLDIPTNYPIRPPAVRFLTRIFHPNISRHGDIGLDILSHQWIPALTVAKLALCVQSVLTDPNPTVSMEPGIGRLALERPKVFSAIAKHWTYRYAMTDALLFP